MIETEEDEVLFAIAEEIGKVWDLLGDPLRILPLLEKLCAVEETVVRNEVSPFTSQSAKSINKIAKTLSDAEIQNELAPLTIRLASADWFTSRVSACALFYDCYPKAGS